MSAATLADRTTAASGRSASVAICASDSEWVPILLSPALTAMIASTWAAFSNTRKARDGAGSGIW